MRSQGCGDTRCPDTQLISTDFPHGDRIENGYAIAIPGGTPSRCNPVTAPDRCEATGIEDLS